MRRTFEGLGFDPAPGEPQAVAELTHLLGQVQAEVAHTAADLRAVGADGGAWQGQAATAFAEQLGVLPGYLDGAERSTGQALVALVRWEAELVDLQARAVSLEAQAVSARAQALSAHGMLTGVLRGLPVTPEQNVEFAAAAARAQQAAQSADDGLGEVLDRARALLAEYERAAQQAARLIRSAADDAPPGFGMWDRLGHLLADVAHGVVAARKWLHRWYVEHAELFNQIGDLLADVSAVLGLLSIAIPILAPFALAAAGAALLFHLEASENGLDVPASTYLFDLLGIGTAAASVASGRELESVTRARHLNPESVETSKDLNKLANGSGLAVTGTSEAHRIGHEGSTWASVPLVGPVIGISRHWRVDRARDFAQGIKTGSVRRPLPQEPRDRSERLRLFLPRPTSQPTPQPTPQPPAQPGPAEPRDKVVLTPRPQPGPPVRPLPVGG